MTRCMETPYHTLDLRDLPKKELERGSDPLKNIWFNLSYSREPHLFGQVRDGPEMLGNQWTT